MPRHVLVLHGPNLNLPGTAARTLEELDAELTARASKRDAEVKTFQANGEGALVDRLQAERAWLDAVIVNPSSLAPIAYALADALELIGKPAIEVQLEHEAKGRGRSALRAVVSKQFHGKGTDGYLLALDAALRDEAELKSAATDETDDAEDDAQASDDDDPESEGDAEESTPPAATRGKTIGRKAAVATAEPAKSAKTIGRKPKGTTAPATAALKPAGATTTAGITRALVRTKLGERLSGKLSPTSFAAWARGQWQAVRNGAAVEPGQEELLEDVLLMMAASARANEHLLLSYMAKLET